MRVDEKKITQRGNGRRNDRKEEAYTKTDLRPASMVPKAGVTT